MYEFQRSNYRGTVFQKVNRGREVHFHVRVPKAYARGESSL